MAHSMDKWVGKVAIVTGASAGIGCSIVELLVEHGVIVAGIARRSELIEKHAKKLSGSKGKLYAVKGDMGKEEDILNAFKWVQETLGPISILINNAGVLPSTSLTDGDSKAWKSVLDVNVLGLSIATQAAVKSMKKNNIDGHIIHINSVTGHMVCPFSNWNLYPASKYAVTALTETLRQELNRLGSKIKITSLSPGYTSSEMTQGHAGDNASDKTLQMLSKIKPLQGSDLANGVIYVLSTPAHVQVHELTIRPLNEPY